MQKQINKCKNIFARGYQPNFTEEVFVIKKFTDAITRAFVIAELNGEETTCTRTATQTTFRIENLIEKKSDQRHVKQKRYSIVYTQYSSYRDINLN